MTEVIVFASVSVDGYVAGVGDDLGRLHRWMGRSQPGGQEDPFVQIFRTAGAVVFGRRTFDLGQDPWGEEDVFESPVLVVTHERREQERRNGTTFTFTQGPAGTILAAAEALAAGGHIVVMGSPNIAQQLLAAGLVDTILLHQVPVLLGDGIPFFGQRPATVELVPEFMSPGTEVSLIRFAIRKAVSL